MVTSALRPLAPKLRVTFPWVGSSLIPTVGVCSEPPISIPLLAAATTLVTLRVKSSLVAIEYLVRLEILSQLFPDWIALNFKIWVLLSSPLTIALIK